MNSLTIGLDTAKSVFHAVEKNSRGRVLSKAKLTRAKLFTYFANKQPCTVALEACGASHYWCRVISAYDHKVVMIAPQYVASHRKGNKNDFNDASAIADVAQRDDIRTVPYKSIEQQDIQLLHRVRERLVRQRTALGNQTRGLLSEYGIVLRQGLAHLRKELPFILEESNNELTELARRQFFLLHEELFVLDEKVKQADNEIQRVALSHPISQRLMTMSGVGPIISTILLVALGKGEHFRNGRHFSAWCGLVPKQHSTGDKARLLGISKRGDTYIRTQLINGARSALRNASNKNDQVSRWAASLAERIGFNKACVALANKMARFAWAMVHNGQDYQVKP